MSIVHHPKRSDQDGSDGLYLDLYSTTQNGLCSEAPVCIKNPPQIALPDRNQPSVYRVMQGCCNDWLCPRCGVIRSKQEYGRAMRGMEALEQRGVPMWLYTFTTKGSGLSIKSAMDTFYSGCNRLFSRLRADAKRRDLPWHYYGVTELQKRGHPHLHALMSYHPADLRPGRRARFVTRPDGSRGREYVDCLLSDYVWRSVQDAGLGKIYDIREVYDARGAVVYLGKYLFKDTIHTRWPKGWRRIRVSREWPGQSKQPSAAFPLRNERDWYKLAKSSMLVIAEDEAVYRDCEWYLRGHDVLIRRHAT